MKNTTTTYYDNITDTFYDVLPYTKTDIYTNIIKYCYNHKISFNYQSIQSIAKYITKEYRKSEKTILTRSNIKHLTYKQYLKYKIKARLNFFHSINGYDSMIINYLIQCYAIFNTQ